eukprot:gene361-11740_t
MFEARSFHVEFWLPHSESPIVGEKPQRGWELCDKVGCRRLFWGSDRRGCVTGGTHQSVSGAAKVTYWLIHTRKHQIPHKYGMKNYLEYPNDRPSDHSESERDGGAVPAPTGDY